MVESGALPTVINTFLPLLVVFVAVAYVYFAGEYAGHEIVHHNKAFVHPPDRKLIDKYDLLQVMTEGLVTFLSPRRETSTYNLPKHPQDHDVINSPQDLAETFHYFFEHGAAAERYVSNKTLFHQLVTAVRGFGEQHGSFWRFGGNAPHMGCRIQMEGHNVLLGAHVTKELRDQFAAPLPVAGGLAPTSTEDSDDIHIILESVSDELWGNDTCPRANRLGSNGTGDADPNDDVHSPYLRGIEEVEEEIDSGAFKPDALVLGAFQMMDGFPFPAEGERLQRLQRARQLIDEQDPSVKVHVELASFANSEFMKELYDTGMLTRVDSLGMNEQELTTFTDWLSSLHVLRRNTTRKVTRIHVHTLAFQAVMIKTGAWNRTAEAMSKASLTAFRHVCGFATNEDIDLNKGKVLLFDTFVDSEDEELAQRRDVVKTRFHNGVVCWDDTRDSDSSEKVTMCLSPNIICTDPVATIAAGDNISGAAVAVQI
ncbi:hypothetical protein FOZ60_008703 [Perkinsus olseni]|uniref:ADP-dependent glucokinase n=1 Tax=Perkinsus olseni TaxID=32597 RepID=A0A7J6PFS9_PEROL|nr:hypothetical protein FOZ60_008703 [Perkinsus olseni]